MAKKKEKRKLRDIPGARSGVISLLFFFFCLYATVSGGVRSAKMNSIRYGFNAIIDDVGASLLFAVLFWALLRILHVIFTSGMTVDEYYRFMSGRK